ncbi:lysM and putative peptidoglycan-binding domain-containing protein 1 [Acanthopagrus latus]|uniref:lysM and putative peptidoglycan-binding domain-containing protein 1 n=1 Tax=Acanthopagrus latus TaxID=8177 RepID=UPI00187C0E96|nr:lysM and putative peptidoglycan-binding domain-containing protein 1 [Acanthopagrus latus]XP_036929238.1 lysM and putative peptidoglycan-binding domain-containing protein 1 [Acanthopagrus latus]
MSGERAPLPAGSNGLLRGNRTRSYGSLVRSPLSPVRQRRIEHKIQPGETLQGLALKYGVSMEQIKRANRMYTNDSIFLKKSLSIPVMSDSDQCVNGVDLNLEDSEEDNAGRGSAQNGHTERSSEEKRDDGSDIVSDLTPVDFLKRLDGLISQSKQAAVKGCQDAERRVAALEAACLSRTSDWRPLTRSQSATSSSTLQQQAPHGAVPLTITKLTKKLRDREDEIFQL